MVHRHLFIKTSRIHRYFHINLYDTYYNGKYNSTVKRFNIMLQRLKYLISSFNILE